MDATTATGFFLSKVSKFYGTREITRSFILNWLLPSVSDLFQAKSANVHPPEIPATTLRALAAERLSALNELCRANGSQFDSGDSPDLPERIGNNRSRGKGIGRSSLGSSGRWCTRSEFLPNRRLPFERKRNAVFYLAARNGAKARADEIVVELTALSTLSY